ncbi:hypothetical protein [Caedibacter taeniospiralis]|jgi:hypothetical protein|uniref:hypothetical protein n=1 Tax=Caedibacter taeniospiralis TaxID=28907 RepID=UPI0037C0743E
MTRLQMVKVFLTYFVLYALIGVCSAWIPFFYASVVFGSVSIVLAAITLAVIRTVEFAQTPSQKIGAKKFVIAMLVLVVIDIMYFVLVSY